MNRTRKRTLKVLAAFVVASLTAFACNLNPQPLPPELGDPSTSPPTAGGEKDAGATTGFGDSGDAPPDRPVDSGAGDSGLNGDAGLPDASGDAGSPDGGPLDSGTDAGVGDASTNGRD